jgi:hypothetical protein
MSEAWHCRHPRSTAARSTVPRRRLSENQAPARYAPHSMASDGIPETQKPIFSPSSDDQPTLQPRKF